MRLLADTSAAALAYLVLENLLPQPGPVLVAVVLWTWLLITNDEFRKGN